MVSNPHVAEAGHTHDQAQHRSWVFRRVVTPTLRMNPDSSSKEKQKKGNNGSDLVQRHPPNGHLFKSQSVPAATAL